MFVFARFYINIQFCDSFYTPKWTFLFCLFWLYIFLPSSPPFLERFIVFSLQNCCFSEEMFLLLLLFLSPLLSIFFLLFRYLRICLFAIGCNCKVEITFQSRQMKMPRQKQQQQQATKIYIWTKSQHWFWFEPFLRLKYWGFFVLFGAWTEREREVRGWSMSSLVFVIETFFRGTKDGAKRNFDIWLPTIWVMESNYQLSPSPAPLLSPFKFSYWVMFLLVQWHVQ